MAIGATKMTDTLIDTMVEVGIALYGKGDPYRRLRIAQQTSPAGSARQRTYSKLGKQSKQYLTTAALEARRIYESQKTSI